MADGKPGPSTISTVRLEQKTLSDDFSPVSPIEADASSLEDEFVDAREHSISNPSYRNAFYDAQRIEKRPQSASTDNRPTSATSQLAPKTIHDLQRTEIDPQTAGSDNVLTSATSQPAPRAIHDSRRTETDSRETDPQIAGADNVTISATSPPLSQSKANEPHDTTRSTSTDNRPSSVASPPTPKAKGKRPNVDFREPPESPPTVHSPAKAQPADTEAATRPTHSRGNSYTNFSRPDAVQRNNSKSNVQPSHEKAKSSITALPKPPPEPDRAAASAPSVPKRQNRNSATSSIGSRRLRPPVHQSDLERAQNTASDPSAPIPPFTQSIAALDFMSRKGEVPEPATTWLNELYTISYLIFFAFFGTLARLGVQWLTFYPGAIITTPVVWANFGGSLVMGFLVEDSCLFKDEWSDQVSSTSRAAKRISKQSTKSRRSVFSGDFDRMQRKERLAIKARIPLHVGLTTGFCGCFTSFSIFARDMFLALSNDLPAPPYQANVGGSASFNVARHGGYSFMAVVAVIITELTLSIGGFLVGRQIALLLEDYTPRISRRFRQAFLDRVVVVLAWGCWLGAVLLMIWPPDRQGGPQSAGSLASETWRGVALFAMVFSPVGCLLRYYMGKKLNRLEPSFPLGTFAANMLGAAVMAACYDIQHIGIGDSGSIGGGLLSCQALEGLIDGFTGCLTTVSTLAAEIDSLKRRYAWIYGLSTILAGLSLVVAILGPVRWTVGWSGNACAVGYAHKYS